MYIANDEHRFSPNGFVPGWEMPVTACLLRGRIQPCSPCICVQAPPVLDVLVVLSTDPPQNQMLERQRAVVLNFDGNDCGSGEALTNETLLAMGQKVAASLRWIYGLRDAAAGESFLRLLKDVHQKA